MGRQKRGISRILCLLILLIPASILNAADWGTLTGQFIYTGPASEPEKLEKLEISRDQEICGKFSDQIVNESFVTGKNGGLQNVFVYLRESRLDSGKIHESYQELPPQVTILNQGCIFQPHVTGLWVQKQKLQAVNQDQCAHGFQVKAYRNNSLNQLLPPGEKMQHAFEFGEKMPLRMGCSIHPWQEGWLIPLNHPYFATSDKTGRFTIQHLPVGEWEFQLWHEKAGYLVAKDDWKRGRIKLKINSGKNDLGLIKVTPAMFAGK